VLTLRKRSANHRSGAEARVTRRPTIGGSAEEAKLTVRRVLQPGMGFRVVHVHLDFVESFKVVMGIADARVGGRVLRLAAGDQLVVPSHTPHMNPCNRSRGVLIIDQTFEPATEGARTYVETLIQYIDEGRDVCGDLPPLTAMAVFGSTDSGTFASGIPQSLQRRVVFPLARPIARWRKAYPPELLEQS
jgi:mannose-6-phosphate isomerase-like protein (cupin superfamily)